MTRLVALAAVATFAAGAAHAQARLDLGPERAATLENPLPQQPGVTIASEITDADRSAGAWRAEHFLFTGEAGEVLTLRVKSDIPELLVMVLQRSESGKYAMLFRGPARSAPAQVVLKKDGTHLLIVGAMGAQGSGRYEIDFQSSAVPSSPPAQAAAAPKPPITEAGAPKTAAPAVAQPTLFMPPGVLLAQVGQSMERPAGEAGAAVELFAFMGEAGSVLRATAGAPGAGGHAITLYTPEGEEMLMADGVDQAKLTAVLPKDGIYLLAVGRQTAGRAYKLTLDAEAPDPFLWSFRRNVGYDVLDRAGGSLLYSTCWTEPGVTWRMNHAGGGGTMSVQRGGAGQTEIRGLPARAFTTRFADGVFVRTYADGAPPETWTMDLPQPTGAYRGYLCR